MMKQKFISYGTCRRFSLPKNYFSELGFYYRLGFASRYCDEDEYVCAEKCDSWSFSWDYIICHIAILLLTLRDLVDALQFASLMHFYKTSLWLIFRYQCYFTHWQWRNWQGRKRASLPPGKLNVKTGPP